MEARPMSREGVQLASPTNAEKDILVSMDSMLISVFTYSSILPPTSHSSSHSLYPFPTLSIPLPLSLSFLYFPLSTSFSL